MRKLKLFLSLLMLIAFSVGNVWAADYMKTALADITSSDVVIIVGNNGSLYALSNDKGTGSAPAAVSVSATNDVITTDATNILWNIAKDGNNLTIYPNGTTETWLYCTATNNGVRVGTNANKVFVIDNTNNSNNNAAQNDYLYNSATNRWLGVYNSSDWRCYTTIGANIKNQALSFYVLGDTPSTPTCAKPTFSPENGETFEESIDVEILAEDGTTIYYTTDGETPTTSSSVYSSALNLTETTTVKAIAVKEGSNNSAVAEATYTKMVAVHGYTVDFESDLAAYVDWEFTNLVKDNAITAHGGTYFVNTNAQGSASATTKEKVAKPGVITYYISKKGNNTNANSKWSVQVSTDGSNWTTVGAENNAGAGVTEGTWNECSADLSEYTDVYVRVYYKGTTAVRTLDDIELTMASAIVKPSISGTNNFFTTSEISMTCATEGAEIYYTTDGSDPKTSGTKYTAAFSIDDTKTIKAIAKVGEEWGAVAEVTFTKATVMTVAQARAAIDAGGDLTNKFVAGIISQIDSYQSNYHSITYWISDDGTTTDQLEVYSGLAGVVKSAFASKDDLAVGDDVTVKGTLKKYNSIYEFDYNNTIEAYKPIARLAWSAESYDASLEGTNTFPTLTNTYSVDVTYSSSDAAKASFADASVYDITLNAVGSTTITASFAGNETYKANSVSYTLNVASSLVTLTYNVDGGEAIDPVNVSALPNPLPTTTKAGKNFGGWFTDPEKEVAAVPGAAISENTTIYAKWLDPYTVAEAKTVIDANPTGTENQYVAGIISQIDSYQSNYHSITYWISDDGTTANQLQVYSGLIGNAATALEKEQFTAKEDLELGDEVVVTGTLKLYNEKYEFDKNNSIYTFSRKASAGLEYAETAIQKTVGDDLFTNPLTNPNNVTVTYSSSDEDVAVVDENTGEVLVGEEGTATITAAFAGNPTYKAAEVSYTVTVSAAEPTPASYDYALVTDAAQLQDGLKVIIVAAEADKAAGSAAATYRNVVDVERTTDGNYLILDSENMPTEFTLGVSGNNFTFNDGDGYMYESAAKSVKVQDEAFEWTISIGEGNIATIQATNELRYNSGSPRFTTYASGQQALQLYIKDDGKQAAGLAWSTDAVELTVGDAFEAPTLTNPNNLVVTITSDNEEVATVSEGIVSLVADATGTAKITASYAGDDTYRAASVSYTITVNSAEPPTPPTYDYALVTDAAQLQDGLKVIIVAAEADKAAGSAAATYRNVVDVERTTDGNYLILDSENMPTEFTLGVSGENFTLNDGNGYMYESAAKSVKVQDEAFEWTISIGDGNIATIQATNELRYNSGSPRFTTYASGQQALQLYIKDDGKQAAGLAWSTDAVELTVGDAFEAPTLTNPNNLVVTITSDNEEVATVSEGIVSLVADATGTAKITASYAGDDTYRAASVSYTITVNSAEPPTPPTYDYALVTDAAQLQDGLKVIIVAAEEDKAAGSAAATYRNVVDVERTTDGNYLILDSENMPTEFTLGVSGENFTLNDGNGYMYESAAKSVKVQDEAFEWTISIGDGNIATIQATNELRYNSGSPRFTTYASGQQALQLYVKDDGKQAAGLIWSTDAVELTVGDEFTAPTLTNPNDLTVTIESNNTDLAVVNEGVVSLVENAIGTAKITALFAGDDTYRAASVSYTITVSEVPEPEILVSESTIDFKTVAKDAPVASETVTVTLTSVAEAVIAISGEGAGAFSIDQASLTSTGTIAISANTATVGTYAAMLTISDKAGVAEAKEIALSMKVIEVPYWATVYSSNVNLEGAGESYEANSWVKIDGIDYKAKKVGSSNKDGVVKVMVPKGANTLHFHAAAWNGNDATIAISGVTNPSETSFAVAGDAGVKSSGTYTLENVPFTQYHYFTFDAVTENTTITFSRTDNNDHRFVIYGVNQEGGVWEVTDEQKQASTLPDNADVVLEDGATLTIDEDVTLGDLTVTENTKVEGSNKLTVQTFTISTNVGDNASGEVEVPSIVDADIYQIDVRLISKAAWANGQRPSGRWHSFTVPFPVDPINGVYDTLDNKLTNEVNYAIMKYHGDIRANGQYGWKKEHNTLVPGTFYLITVDGDQPVIRFKKTATGSAVATNSIDMTHYIGTGDATNDHGWNGVGNPNLFSGYAGFIAQILNAEGTAFTQVLANTTKFAVGVPFFIKVDADQPLVIATTLQSSVVARTRTEELKNVKITFGNEAYTDQLYVTASEDALNQYEEGKDLVKMTMSSTPKVAQIFGKAYGNNLCVVNTPLVNNNAACDLTLYAPNAGEYTISAPEMDNADIFLTYEGSIIWNLSMGAYTNNFAKGNNEGYGLILVKKAPQVVTGVDNAEANEAGVQKVIINKHVYILRAEQMYDVTGKMVK